ncbi:patatin-like phospholipase family protein [Aestuariispira insulae]|uniref:NTE family protein n=1 Tax=Aestuariispira insulae TaxID=1461337 RepID=A0A3D9HDU7_9PROT|nr:patatin-like phospholipase family protein [Aestuariispira insulae]RED47640.1 NTE family protein [Aestuariispira insulae]
MANRKPVNLALQGGGAHGAFTWGVLDCLLADGRIAIEAISGTSAGAMNAVVLADGLMKGGEDAARKALHDFWKAISDAGRMNPIQRGPLDVWLGHWGMENSPAYLFFDLINRLASPYDLNPHNLNPLREILESRVDFDAVRACDKVRVMVSATNVETGRVKIFRHGNLTVEKIMASACLPFLFQAVEIDGVPYWDGGYMGNPVLFPFYSTCESSDIVIVQINPMTRPGTPKSAREILDRVNEITFNGSLMKELRAIEFVQRLLDEGRLDERRYRRLQMHMIEAEEEILPLGASSKMNTEWRFFKHLFRMGHAAAERWLDAHFDKIGQQSSVDLRSIFQGGYAEAASDGCGENTSKFA